MINKEKLLPETEADRTWYNTRYKTWKEKKDLRQDLRYHMHKKQQILQALLYLIKKHMGHGFNSDAICFDDLVTDHEYLSHEAMREEIENELKDKSLNGGVRDVLRRCYDDYHELYLELQKANTQMPPFTTQDVEYWQACSLGWLKANPNG